MKKAVIFILVAGFFGVALLGSPVFAENSQDDSKQKETMPPLPAGLTAYRPGMNPSMMGMRSPMSTGAMESFMVMQALKEKSIVATSDGGVVVVVGNQMIKYDRDLKVVRKSEIQVDLEALKQSLKSLLPPPGPAMFPASMGQHGNLPLGEAFGTKGEKNQAAGEKAKP